MRVLFLTYHFLTDNGGGVFASKAYINAFASLSEECLLLYPVCGKEAVKDLDFHIKKIGIDIGSYLSVWKLLYYLKGEYNYFLRSCFERYLKDFLPDVVVFDHSRISSGLLDIACAYNARIITLHHNYEVEYIKGNDRSLKRYVAACWMKRIEKEALLKSDLNLFITATDLKQMRENYHIPVENSSVLGCFEYLLSKKKCFSSNGEEVPYKPVFVITGDLGGAQTEKSILIFLEEYYSDMIKIIPSHLLLIAGKRPSAFLKKRIKTFSAIELIDTPMDMDYILSKADYYLCPTMFGSGLKLRIMDGLKWGLPVLTHALSSRGYENLVRNGCVLVYHDRYSFREALNQLLIIRYSKNDIYMNYISLFGFANGVKRLKFILSRFGFIE